MTDILNDGEITRLDKRNDLARKHIGHKVVKIGLNTHVENKVPYLKTRKQKYLCEDCRTMFDAYNTTEDENSKRNILKDVFKE